MITGMHVAVISKEFQANYDFLRDKVGLPSYDAGGGFLIFEPPSIEIACHPADEPTYEVSFFCDDVKATKRELEGRGVVFTSEIREESWGSIAEFSLPDGRSVGLYERKYSKANPIGPT